MKSISALTALLTVLALSVGTTARAQWDDHFNSYEDPIVIDQNAPHYEYHLDTRSLSMTSIRALPLCL